MLKNFWLFFCIISSYNVHCAKILGFFFHPSISHQMVFQPIWKELSLRGHQVTVITPNVLNDPTLTNLTEIDVSFTYDILREAYLTQIVAKDNFLMQTILNVFGLAEKIIRSELEFPAVRELINDKKQEFDLVMVQCYHPLSYGIAARFKAPIIGIASLGVLLHDHDSVGNPTHPVLHPDLFLDIIDKKPSFLDRIKSVLYNAFYRIFIYGYYMPKADAIAREYFGSDMPYLGNLQRNISLLMLNVNPILHPIRPNVPAIIELGLMHIKPKKPLPKEIQDILDSATQGVVYFSLGSNMKSANLSENIRNTIIDGLSRLPYTVLWKWETDHLPNQPKNVITRKWLPQQDILGHPNIKVFVTQGGLQSIEEAVVNGVPVVGMPFFGDQPMNVQKMVEFEIAKKLNINTMTAEELRGAIVEVATDSKYKKNVLEIRELLLDQPMKSLDKAVWWIEYVIRHRGARHLRSGALDLPWYQYFLLDVLAFLLVLTAFFLYLSYLIIRYLRLFFKPTLQKLKAQ